MDNNEQSGADGITIRGAQQLVDDWIKTTGVRYFSELTNMAILTEEVGEVARLMSRIYGDQSFKESDKGKELGDELADVLWVLLCIANQTGVDLTAALEKNLEKKNVRDGSRHRGNAKL
jgi:NTP pyrophosphatase (non-canonical NTP hydrolase)